VLSEAEFSRRFIDDSDLYNRIIKSNDRIRMALTSAFAHSGLKLTFRQLAQLNKRRGIPRRYSLHFSLSLRKSHNRRNKVQFKNRTTQMRYLVNLILRGKNIEVTQPKERRLSQQLKPT